MKFRIGLESQRKPKNKEKLGHDFLSHRPCLLHLSGRTESSPCLPPPAKISNAAALPMGCLFHTTAAFSALTPSLPTPHIPGLKENVYRKVLTILLAKPTLKEKKERGNETKVKASSNFLLSNYVTSYMSSLISFRW